MDLVVVAEIVVAGADARVLLASVVVAASVKGSLSLYCWQGLKHPSR